MLKRVKFDDSGRIYFNYDDTSLEELDNCGLSYFDVYNMPYRSYDEFGYTPQNYYLSFFSCDKSSTGYVGMFIHKNRTIFKAKIGYTPETSVEVSYKYERND